MAWILALCWEVFAVEEGSVQPNQSTNPQNILLHITCTEFSKCTPAGVERIQFVFV